MKWIRSSTKRRLIVFAVLSASSFSIHAQGLVTAPYPADKTTLILHYQNPVFKTDFGYIFPHGSFEALTIVPLGSRVFTFAAIPFGVGSAEFCNDTITWTISPVVLGNISVGIGDRTAAGERINLANSFVLVANTISQRSRPGTAGYWAIFAGWYSDPNRAERFARDYWSFYTNSQFSYNLNSRSGLNCEIRPQWFVPNGRWGHGEFYLNGGLSCHVGSNRIQGVAEYVLAWWIGGNNPGSRGSNTFSDGLGFGIRVAFNTMTPTLYYQFALGDDYTTPVNGTWGLKLDFELSLKEKSQESRH